MNARFKETLSRNGELDLADKLYFLNSVVNSPKLHVFNSPPGHGLYDVTEPVFFPVFSPSRLGSEFSEALFVISPYILERNVSLFFPINYYVSRSRRRQIYMTSCVLIREPRNCVATCVIFFILQSAFSSQECCLWHCEKLISEYEKNSFSL